VGEGKEKEYKMESTVFNFEVDVLAQKEFKMKKYPEAVYLGQMQG
jgi:hypothetical protein